MCAQPRLNVRSHYNGRYHKRVPGYDRVHFPGTNRRSSALIRPPHLSLAAVRGVSFSRGHRFPPSLVTGDDTLVTDGDKTSSLVTDGDTYTGIPVR